MKLGESFFFLYRDRGNSFPDWLGGNSITTLCGDHSKENRLHGRFIYLLAWWWSQFSVIWGHYDPILHFGPSPSYLHISLDTSSFHLLIRCCSSHNVMEKISFPFCMQSGAGFQLINVGLIVIPMVTEGFHFEIHKSLYYNLQWPFSSKY